MSQPAKPVRKTAVVGRVDEHPQSRSATRPDLAEVASWIRGARRLVSRLGAIVPVLFMLITIAVASSLGQPLRGGVDLGELTLWTAFTLMLLTPFIAAALVMLTARRGGSVWTTALVYTLLAGLLGVGVDITVLGTDFSSASLSLVSALIVQVLLLAPVCAAVAFLIGIVRDSARR